MARSPARSPSQEYNYSHIVNLREGTQFVRSAQIEPDRGVLDDLGYSEVLRKIESRHVELDASLHYPTQLRIRAQVCMLLVE